jgi:hypothetical protein
MDYIDRPEYEIEVCRFRIGYNVYLIGYS